MSIVGDVRAKNYLPSLLNGKDGFLFSAIGMEKKLCLFRRVLLKRRRWKVHTKEIGKNLFLVDLEIGGFRDLVASYVLKGKESVIVETGPASSVANLLSGLEELNVKSEDVAYVAVSHVHLDHGGGVGVLLKSLPNAKVIVHPKGAAHLVNPE